MFPEAGVVGWVYATMVNIRIDVYRHDLVLFERYKPMRPHNREPLVVSLVYKSNIHFDVLMNIYCSCKRPNSLALRHGDPMIECVKKDECVHGRWFHQGCLSFSDARWAEARKDAEWLCMECENNHA
jgi:hypothetical protein